MINELVRHEVPARFIPVPRALERRGYFKSERSESGAPSGAFTARGAWA
jgi:hypothetical protein